jgi:hypothetical protein
MTDETYEGWTNRETWAVALHINNDQGWQESVHEALRENRYRRHEVDNGQFVTVVPSRRTVSRSVTHTSGASWRPL